MYIEPAAKSLRLDLLKLGNIRLLIHVALAGGGSFATGPLTLHTKTNIEVIKKFLNVDLAVVNSANGNHVITIEGTASV